MRDLALEGVVRDVAAVGQDAGDFHKVVLAGEELRGEKLVVAERAFGPIDADIKAVGHLCVEGGHAAADLSILEFDVDRDCAGVVGGIAAPDLIGGDFLYRRAGEPSQGIDGVASGRHQGRASRFCVPVWYPKKGHPSFQDALASLRRRLWTQRIISMFGKRLGHGKNTDVLLEALSRAV